MVWCGGGGRRVGWGLSQTTPWAGWGLVGWEGGRCVGALSPHTPQTHCPCPHLSRPVCGILSQVLVPLPKCPKPLNQPNRLSRVRVVVGKWGGGGVWGIIKCQATRARVAVPVCKGWGKKGRGQQVVGEEGGTGGGCCHRHLPVHGGTPAVPQPSTPKHTTACLGFACTTVCPSSFLPKNAMLARARLGCLRMKEQCLFPLSQHT